MSSRCLCGGWESFAGAANQKPALTERQCWRISSLEGARPEVSACELELRFGSGAGSPKIERRRSEII